MGEIRAKHMSDTTYYNHQRIIQMIAHYIPQSLSSLPSTQSALKSHMFDTSMMFDWSSHINTPV